MQINEAVAGRLLQDISEGILFSSRGKISFMNPAAIYILGLDEDELLGKPLVAAFCGYRENDAFTQALLDAIYDNAAPHEQIVPYFDGNNLLHLHLKTSFLRDGDRKLGLIAVFSDVSELLTLRGTVTDAKQLKKLNYQLERRNKQLSEARDRYKTEAQTERKSREALMELSAKAKAASEAKSAFLSQMSHEIRTPINAVLGMNEMILRETRERQTREYAESIRTAGASLLAIVNDILDFSKIEAGKMEIIPAEYDLSSLINDLVIMVQARANAKGLALTLDLDPRTPRILRGDDVRLKQIIANLLTNAVKYTAKGKVTFAIKREKTGERQVLLKISVQDTGQGIKAEDLPKLFSKFERLDERQNRYTEGTGLGLSITSKLLELMGSRLEVESVYGQGSRFYFTLAQEVVRQTPLGDYRTAYRESLAQKRAAEGKFTAPGARILVVDDNHMNVTVFCNLLRRTKVGIDTAYSGNEGLALARENPYDLIFLDHMMPGKNGIETLRELKGRSKGPNLHTPVVCLTANAISGAREEYMAEGFNDYLTKPIDPDKLEQMLLDYLPPEKVLASAAEAEGEKTGGEEPSPLPASLLPDFLREIGELDLTAGLKNNGDEKSYLEALQIYADMADKYTREIADLMAAGDMVNATIKIHALKSTSRIIGATAIGKIAQALEDAGKAGDRKTLQKEAPGLLVRCNELGKALRPLLEKPQATENSDTPALSQAERNVFYRRLREAADNCDSFGIEEILAELRGRTLPTEEKERLASIAKATEDFDFDRISELLTGMGGTI